MSMFNIFYLILYCKRKRIKGIKAVGPVVLPS